jgi:hypothetical protein
MIESCDRSGIGVSSCDRRESNDINAVIGPLVRPLLGEHRTKGKDYFIMDAVDRFVFAHETVQRLQHEPIAAECNDDIGRFGVYPSIARDGRGTFLAARLRGQKFARRSFVFVAYTEEDCSRLPYRERYFS